MSDETSQVTSQVTPQELTSDKAIGNFRTFRIALPLKSSFSLTTEDLLKILQFLFDKVIQGTEESVDITISSDLFNITIVATLSK
jgi:hypothetical protein